MSSPGISRSAAVFASLRFGSTPEVLLSAVVGIESLCCLVTASIFCRSNFWSKRGLAVCCSNSFGSMVPKKPVCCSTICPSFSTICPKSEFACCPVCSPSWLFLNCSNSFCNLCMLTVETDNFSSMLCSKAVFPPLLDSIVRSSS